MNLVSTWGEREDKTPIWPDYSLEVIGLGSLLFASFVAVVRIVHRYLPLHKTSAVVLVPVLLALWLPAGVVMLVPIDLASTTTATTAELASPALLDWILRHTTFRALTASSPMSSIDRVHALRFPPWALLLLWRLFWWSTFLLTWFVLPLLQHYMDAGYRSGRDRAMYAVRAVGRDKAIILVIGLAGLVYMFASYGVSRDSVRTVVLAVPYSWLLAQAIFFMGHGLVTLPGAAFRQSASRETRLRLLRERAPWCYTRMVDAAAHLDALEGQVAELAEADAGEELDAWIDALLGELVPEEEAERLRQLHQQHIRGRRFRADAALPRRRPDVLRLSSAMAARFGAVATTVVSPRAPRRQAPVTKDYLADLTRRLQQARHEKAWRIVVWNRLVGEASDIEETLQEKPSSPLFGRALRLASFGALAVVLAIASACIVWSEIIKAFHPRWSAVRLTVIHYWWMGTEGLVSVSIGGQLTSAAWILYMYAAMLASATDLGHWRHTLVPGHTDAASALWYACQVTKMVVPLSYNFVTYLSPRIYEQTTFYEFIGQLVDLTPLGRWFNQYFPIFIVIPVYAALFGVYGRVKRLMGLRLGNHVGPLDEEINVVSG
ncbi:hypothetical protein P8C59_005969 [Phyllachora maydis]|uniref:Uncharacterized protein n=1 Tax=Phyllachora maydis TaxID=1825666 RepID=A0AAD9I5G2_9PEZI|nr:hypothetical protein P8C59_005969 [Phyllachora maydis]